MMPAGDDTRQQASGDPNLGYRYALFYMRRVTDGITSWTGEVSLDRTQLLPRRSVRNALVMSDL